MNTPSEPTPRPNGPTPDEVREVIESLRGIRFGVVQVVVQDGVIVQIERTEKRRLRGARSPAAKTPTA